jgi:hypothetical protein
MMRGIGMVLQTGAVDGTHPRRCADPLRSLLGLRCECLPLHFDNGHVKIAAT